MGPRLSKIILDLTDGLAGPANPRHLPPVVPPATPSEPLPTAGLAPAVKIELEVDGKAYAGRLYTTGQPASA
jgi:hypothetical protein